MSLITQCPACATMFKVVPDQLRISDGWVRCGQCDEVFDANANLHADSARPLSVDPSNVSSSAADQGTGWSASAEVAVEQSAVDALVDEPFRVEVMDATALGGSGDAEDIDVIEPEPSAAMDDLDALLALRPGHGQDDSRAEEKGAFAARPLAEDSEPRYAQVQVKNAQPADSPAVSFMRKKHSASVWHRTASRVFLSLVALILVGVLGLQVVVLERDRILASAPESESSLLALCEWWGCKLQPLRQIESIVIDSSSFAKVRADVYRLNLTLKSTANIALASPALELTLTDLQDQALVRRVLLVADMVGGKQTLNAGAEMNLSVPIAVKPNGTERIAGYRLLAFYP